MDALADDLQAFVSRLALFLDIDLKLVFALPYHIVSAFDNLIASLSDVGESLLEQLLSLCDLLLALIELISLVSPLSV